MASTYRWASCTNISTKKRGTYSTCSLYVRKKVHYKNLLLRNEGDITRAAGGEREGSPQGDKGGCGISWAGGEGVVRCATQAEVRGEEEG